MSIEIHPYRDGWPDEFQQIAQPLRSALGALALRIDHIGSTAVPGLAAKDVIDVQVTVAALAPTMRTALQDLRYSWAERVCRDHVPPGQSADEAQWRKWFFRPPPGQRATNLHVRIAGGANQRYALLFRDYLREHPPSAAAYGELKRRLAENLVDPDRYPDVKDPAVDLIYLAAKAWKASSGWTMGPTDA